MLNDTEFGPCGRYVNVFSSAAVILGDISDRVCWKVFFHLLSCEAEVITAHFLNRLRSLYLRKTSKE
jgi:hypothetical protein